MLSTSVYMQIGKSEKSSTSKDQITCIQDFKLKFQAQYLIAIAEIIEKCRCAYL